MSETGETFCPGLETAIEAEPRGTRERLLKALGLMGEAKFRAAKGELRDLAGAEPPSAPALGLMGLLSSLEGRSDDCTRWLKLAARAEPRDAWPRVLSGVVAARKGALADARREFDAALRAAEDPAVLELRADALSAMGHVVEAIRDLDRALELAGPRGSLYFKRALFHMQRRKHRRALLDLKRAMSRDPREPLYVARRSELFLMLGRLDAAQKDADAACRMSPRDESLRLASLRLLLMRGKTAAARTLMLRLARSASLPTRLEARFLSGYAAFKLRRFAAAAAAWQGLVEELPGTDSLAWKARFYWLVSRLVDPKFTRRHGLAFARRKGGLRLIGLGLFPPYDAPVEALHALAASDVLFNNLPHPEVREFLHAFVDDIRASTYDAAEDEFLWAGRMFDEAGKKRQVSFATRGHPLMFGRLACEVLRRCRSQGVAHETLAGPTSVEALLSRAATLVPAPYEGYRVLNDLALERARSLDVKLPSVLNFYHGVPRGRVGRVRSLLERCFPPRHRVLMFGPKYDTAPADFELGELDARFPEIHASLILYIPALHAPRPSEFVGSREPRAGARLILCGLGLFPPRSVPLGVLHELSRSDVVFCGYPGAAGWLEEFCSDVRDAGADQGELARAALGELARGRTAALALIGYPARLGAQICALIARCSAAGVEISAHGGPSPLGQMLARLGIGLGEHIQGAQSYSAAAFPAAAALDVSLPVVLSCYEDLTREAPRLREALGCFYPADHPLTAFGPRAESPWLDLKLRELDARFPILAANTHFHVPPVGGIEIPAGEVPGMPSAKARRPRTDA